MTETNYTAEDFELAIDTTSVRDHDIITARLEDGDGYAAWIEDEEMGARALADTRWEAIYHLAIIKEAPEHE